MADLSSSWDATAPLPSETASLVDDQLRSDISDLDAALAVGFAGDGDTRQGTLRLRELDQDDPFASGNTFVEAGWLAKREMRNGISPSVYHMHIEAILVGQGSALLGIPAPSLGRIYLMQQATVAATLDNVTRDTITFPQEFASVDGVIANCSDSSFVLGVTNLLTTGFDSHTSYIGPGVVAAKAHNITYVAFGEVAL